MGIGGATLGLARELVDRTTVRLGFGHSEERLVRDAQTYWCANTTAAAWRRDSHFRDADEFQAGLDWWSVGRDHWDLFERLARTTDRDGRLSRVVEWGCGGGANAVAFAPHCDEFVGVDVNEDSVAECARQVAASCRTPFTGVVADLDRPEDAAGKVGKVDLFLCCYVLELVPSPEYGLRLMRIAHDVLADGGLAFVQIKYRTGNWRTAPRRHRYRESVVASMTTYRIETFWTAMVDLGFRPEACHLVPRNALDSRYAYFLLTKPAQS